MFENPAKSEIDALLRARAPSPILGLSATPGKPSHNVASALQKFGYRIVPVNPTATGNPRRTRWPDLESALKGAGPVDVVDVFRRPEHVAAIVDDAIRLEGAGVVAAGRRDRRRPPRTRRALPASSP